MNEPAWDLYRTFLAVLREGSLSGAARRLGLAQPTVARQVEALEAALGVELFLRSRLGLVPTDKAFDLQPLAETLAATSAALLRSARAGTDEVAGTVRIGASEMVGLHHLPPILARLRRNHPRLAIELVLSNAAEDLPRRDADLAVRMFAPEQEVLVARRLPPLPLGLYAHADYLGRRGTPLAVEDLSTHDLVGFDRETPALRAFVERYPFFSRAAFALATDSDSAQLAAICAGLGIGVCQVPIARGDPALVRLLPDAFDLSLDLWIVMHEDLRRSRRCRVVFDALVEGLARIGEEPRP